MEDKDKRLTLREWAEDDRPREKMLRKGIQSLSDAELLAILIRSGSKNETVVELSRRILHECHDNLNELAQLSVLDFCRRFKGIGEAKAITVIAALELGKRRKTHETLERKKITSSKDLMELFEPLLIDLPHEEFWVAFINSGNRVIETYRLTQGGSKQTVVDIPMLLKLALTKSLMLSRWRTIILRDKSSEPRRRSYYEKNQDRMRCCRNWFFRSYYHCSWKMLQLF
jgi:DNA repair protein RadC